MEPPASTRRSRSRWITRRRPPAAIAGALERVLVWLARRPHAEADAPTTGSIPLDVCCRLGAAVSPARRLLRRPPDWLRWQRLRASRGPRRRADAARARARRVQGARLLARSRAHSLRARVRAPVPRRGRRAARLAPHASLARFITFDATVQPKPILVMEFVRGTNLEPARGRRAHDAARFTIVESALGSHRDARHPNRAPRRQAGEPRPPRDHRQGGARRLRSRRPTHPRRLRQRSLRRRRGLDRVDERFVPCAPTSTRWLRRVGSDDGSVLFGGDSVKEVLDQHFTKQPAADHSRAWSATAASRRSPSSCGRRSLAIPSAAGARRGCAPASKRSRTTSRRCRGRSRPSLRAPRSCETSRAERGSYRPRRPRCSTNETTLDRTVRLSLDPLRRRIRPGARSLRGRRTRQHRARRFLRRRSDLPE